MKQLKILYVYSGKARPGAGGLDLVTRQELQALVEAGHRVVFVSRGRYEHPLVRNVCLKVTPAHVFSSLHSRYYYSAQHRFFSWLGVMLLRREKFDLVIGWSQQSRQLFRTANKFGIPCFLNCASSYFKFFPGRQQPRYSWPYTSETYLDEEYQRATRLLTPSEFTSETFVQLGFPEEKVVFIGRGADVARFAPRVRPEEPFRAIFFGLVCDRKGIFQTLEAWRLAGIENGELWVVGHVDDEVKDRLLNNIPDRVSFKGYSKSPEDYLQQCHVQILPTRFEGMAKSLVEGAACGLVTITTKASGFPVESGVTGYYVERDDTLKIAEHLRFLASNPAIRKKMGEDAAAFVNTNLTWQMFRIRFIESLRALR